MVVQEKSSNYLRKTCYKPDYATIRTDIYLRYTVSGTQ